MSALQRIVAQIFDPLNNRRQSVERGANKNWDDADGRFPSKPSRQCIT
jgi:hypothetical protein